jgi:hypothetical protein
MKTAWTKGLNPERSLEVHREFKEALLFKKRLLELLEEKLKTKQTETLSKDLYKDSSWAYFQADGIGYQRGISEIISLLSD